MTAPFTTTHNMSTLDGIVHGFFGRKGGVSNGLYDSLNIGEGSNDRAEDIAANRAIIRKTMGADHLLSCYQIHSPTVVIVTQPWTERPQADAMVTRAAGFALCILTADCVPVLFADPVARVIGAAHAGWRGAQGGVIESTVAAMESLGADRSRIAAAIGPCIAQASYEVDAPFRSHFTEADEGHFEAGRQGHWQFDLEAYVCAQLRASGIRRIDPLGLDTYALEERFFSFRRATHRGEASYGRQASLIAVPAPVA